MKVKRSLEKGKVKNVLRGTRVAKKMKLPAKKIAGIVKTNADLPLSNKDGLKKSTRTLASKTTKKNKVLVNPTLNKLDVSSSSIKDAVNILMDLQNEHKQSAKATLLNDKDAVFLQIVWMKKPEVPDPRRKYVRLHHGVFGGDPEICLFVKDYIPYDQIKRTPDEKIELTIEHYQEMLKLHGVNNVLTIMPMYQLKTEYDSYELKRKLVDRFDLFLTQSNLLEHSNYFKKLGIAFTKKNKVPLALKFPHDLLKPDPTFGERVNNLICSSWFTLKPHSDTVTIRFGNVSHTRDQLADNLQHVLYQLTEEADDALPGGVKNVRSLMIKTSRSKVVPLYVNLAPKASLSVPILKSLKPHVQAVEGELTTQLGKKVIVNPDGEVFVIDDPEQRLHSGWNSDEEISDEEDKEESEPTGKQIKTTQLPGKQKKKTNTTKNTKDKKSSLTGEQENSGDSENEEAEVAEKQYLKARQHHVQMEKKDVDIPQAQTLPNKTTKKRKEPPVNIKTPKSKKTPVGVPSKVPKETSFKNNAGKLRGAKKSTEDTTKAKPSLKANETSKKLASPVSMIVKSVKSKKTVVTAKQQKKKKAPAKIGKPAATRQKDKPKKKQ